MFISRTNITQRRLAKRDRLFVFIRSMKQRRGCAKCGVTKGELTLDHIIPRYLGGRPHHRLMSVKPTWHHVLWYLSHPNIQVLCVRCHDRKSKRESSDVKRRARMRADYDGKG